jgi:hypothetical protein
MEEADRRRVWRLYGWYSGLMACGSCLGAVAWASHMMYEVHDFRGQKSPSLSKADQYSHFALSCRWRIVFLVTDAIEFLCLTAAKLMVLDRMSVFAAPQGIGARRWWAAAERIVMAAVVLGNAVGLAANSAAAIQYQKAFEAYSTTSAYYAANNIEGSNKSADLFQEFEQLGDSIASVQRFSEVAVLLLVVVAFVVVGVLSARRVSSRLLGVDADSSDAAIGRALRLQMIGTAAFVFVAFLIRSVHSIMDAVALALRDSKTCPGFESTLCEASCYNVYTFIQGWMAYTPEFESTIVLISSPVALLVALWGMTSKATLQLMESSEQERAKH